MKEHAFCRGRLACIDVGNDSDIANARDVEVGRDKLWTLWGASCSVEAARRVGSRRGMSAQTQQHSVCPHALAPTQVFFLERKSSSNFDL
jgi:hypothetical protein